MAFDTNSYIAGIATGRNMESWPALEGENIFRFTVEYSSETSVIYSGLMVFDGVIDWGDGTTETFNNVPANYDYDTRWRGIATHIYSSYGTYQVSLIGNLLDWATRTMAYGEFGLVSIDTPFPRSMQRREDFTRVCEGAVKLTSLPSGLFRYCPNVKTLARGFSSNPTLHTVPPDLLEGCVNLESVVFLFEMNSYIDRYGVGLTDLPSSLFSQCPSITDMHGAFYYNKGLRTIPDGFLDVQQNLRNASDMFYQSGITAIPRWTFANCPLINDFTSTFFECEDIVEDLPPLWEDFSHLRWNQTGWCFWRCRNAPNYADVPDTWKEMIDPGGG